MFQLHQFREMKLFWNENILCISYSTQKSNSWIHLQFMAGFTTSYKKLNILFFSLFSIQPSTLSHWLVSSMQLLEVTGLKASFLASQSTADLHLQVSLHVWLTTVWLTTVLMTTVWMTSVQMITVQW